MRASVIVPAHNASTTLPRTLAALATQEIDEAFEVIVVDDGSTDQTSEVAAEAGARLVRRDRAAGPGAARNAGVAAARGEVLAFTDADCAPTAGWLAAGISALETAQVVQGSVLPRPDVAVGPFDRSIWVTRLNGLFVSASMFVRREAFERVGGFDDGLLDLVGSHFGEDITFGWRARRAGIETSFCAEALVHHEVFARGPVEMIRERQRLAYFCELVRRVPELRETFFHRRFFLNQRSFRFSCAIGGLAGAAIARHPLPALAALPYLRVVRRDLRGNGVGPAAVFAVADGVGLAALVRGSVRFRRLVL